MRPGKRASRARMYMQRDLGWLNGFPCGGRRWIELPPGGPARVRTLDGKLMQRANRTLNRLQREFPRDLPRLVGDAVRWAMSVRALLELLKPTIHGAAPLAHPLVALHPFAGACVKRRSRKLHAQREALGPLLVALEWYGWLRPDSLEASLRWVESRHELLEVITHRLGEAMPTLAVRLWQLTSRYGCRRTDPVLDLLGNEFLWRRPLECPVSHIQESMASLKKRDATLPTLPAATLPTRVVSWVHWLSEQDRALQRGGLELFPLLADTGPAEAWQAWWSKLECVRDRANDLPGTSGEDDAAASPRRSARLALGELARRAPASLPATTVEAVIRGLATRDARRLATVIIENLDRWPAFRHGVALRLVFAEHWMTLWSRCDLQRRGMLVHLIVAITEYLVARDFSAKAMAPWRTVWGPDKNRRRPRYGIDDDIMEDLPSRTRLDTFFQVLGAQGDGLTMEQARLLCTLVAELPPSRVMPAFADLKDTALIGHYLMPECVQVAAELTVELPECFPRLLIALDRGACDCEKLRERVRALVEVFSHAGLHRVLVEALCTGALQSFLESAAKLALIDQRGLERPSIWTSSQARPGWIDDFPQDLRPPLEFLAQHDPRARETARRILSKDFPDPDAVARELARLRRLDSPSAGQTRRIQNLEARLQRPGTRSAQRLGNLGKKLHEAAVRRLLKTWHARVDEQCQAALLAHLRVPGVPDWMSRPQVRRALLPIQDLTPATQDLARRIVARRCGPQPWDFREHAANGAFLNALVSRGMDPAPWLEQSWAFEATTDDGLDLVLSLERDPVEILMMGEHFGTCLSPGELNYFSVFSNIVDVNKQVVYARDPRGQVFGRMLLALTDEGGLLPFHPYARCQKVGFSAIARAFAQDLASRMRTIVVRSGTVSTLMASGWYDDGPIDLTEPLPGFREDAPFRVALTGMPARDFVAGARRAIAPLELDALTLPLLLALPELESRPELVARLLPVTRRMELPLHGLLRLAQLLALAGEQDLRPIAERIYRAAVAHAGEHRLSRRVAAFLVRCAPARGLQFLRHTRDAHVRRWSDEWDGFRLVLAAEAHARLRRRNQARELYRLAMDSRLDDTGKEACRHALAALGD